MRKIRAGDGIVYGIADPDTLQTVYIGETLGTMTSRLFQHLATSTRIGDRLFDTEFNRWLRSIVISGKIPLVYLIETVKSTGDGSLDKRKRLEAETFWIKRMSSVNPLLNAVKSTTSAKVHSLRTAEERSEIIRKAWAGRSPEHRSEIAHKIWATRRMNA